MIDILLGLGIGGVFGFVIGGMTMVKQRDDKTSEFDTYKYNTENKINDLHKEISASDDSYVLSSVLKGGKCKLKTLVEDGDIKLKNGELSIIDKNGWDIAKGELFVKGDIPVYKRGCIKKY